MTRPNGFYWIRPNGNAWTVGQWWDDCWMLMGCLSLPGDEDFETLEVGPMLTPPETDVTTPS